MKRYIAFLSLIFVLFISGCGYTTQSLLPSNYKTIYVDNFKNKINVTAEQSNLRMYRGYMPGMETTITRAVIDKYLFDGNLKIAPEHDADLVLTADFVDFRREALAYDANDNVQEYRLKLIVDMELKDNKTGKTLWAERNFSGETTYNITGGLAQSEQTAVDAATQDLARRIVERTVEAW